MILGAREIVERRAVAAPGENPDVHLDAGLEDDAGLGVPPGQDVGDGVHRGEDIHYLRRMLRAITRMSMSPMVSCILRRLPAMSIRVTPLMPRACLTIDSA